jgi:Fe-S-cluster formation regulator IscX/YfhJ
MLYALRDDAGNITALTDRPIPDARPVDAAAPEVLNFLSLDASAFTANEFLDDSDLSTIRILEDLIDTLIDRQVLRFTDLPEAAQRKLLSRKVARSIVHPDEYVNTDQSEMDDGMFLKDEDQLF